MYKVQFRGRILTTQFHCIKVAEPSEMFPGAIHITCACMMITIIDYWTCHND